MPYILVSSFVLALGIAVLVAFALLAVSLIISNLFGAPYVPVERKNVKRILEIGGLTSGDVICDLGSGDGRVLFEAVNHFGASRGIGYEVSFWPYWQSLLGARRNKLHHRVTFYPKNFLKERGDAFSDVTFLYIYTYPPLMKKISSVILSHLKKGTRMMAVSFDLPDNPDWRLVKVGDAGWHRVFLYEKIR